MGGLGQWLADLRFVEWVVILGAIGQTLFVAVWATLPWWQEWIGRALMIKSIALLLLFDNALLILIRPQLHSIWVDRVVYTLILIGIWSQVAALINERRAAGNAHRRVTGTHHDDFGQTENAD